MFIKQEFIAFHPIVTNSGNYLITRIFMVSTETIKIVSLDQCINQMDLSANWPFISFKVAWKCIVWKRDHCMR